MAKGYAVESFVPNKLVKLAYRVLLLLSAGEADPQESSTSTSSKGQGAQGELQQEVSHTEIPGISNEFDVSETTEFGNLCFEELLLFLRLLKNLVFNSPIAAVACVAQGVFELVGFLWSFSTTEEELMQELLGLLLNLSSHTNAVKEGIARKDLQAGTGGLMDQICDFILRNSPDCISYRLCLSILQSLITLPEPRASFLRGGYVMQLIHQFHQALNSSEQGHQFPLIEFLINVTASSYGQQLVLKSFSCEGLFDTLLNVAEQSPSSSVNSALFLLRNLAFSSESRICFLSNPRTIPILLKSLQSPSLEAQAYSSSALWALISGGCGVAKMYREMGVLPLLTTAVAANNQNLEDFERRQDVDTVENTRVGTLLRHIKQSLFAVIRLTGGDQQTLQQVGSQKLCLHQTTDLSAGKTRLVPETKVWTMT